MAAKQTTIKDEDSAEHASSPGNAMRRDKFTLSICYLRWHMKVGPLPPRASETISSGRDRHFPSAGIRGVEHSAFIPSLGISSSLIGVRLISTGLERWKILLPPFLETIDESKYRPKNCGAAQKHDSEHDLGMHRITRHQRGAPRPPIARDVCPQDSSPIPASSSALEFIRDGYAATRNSVRQVSNFSGVGIPVAFQFKAKGSADCDSAINVGIEHPLHFSCALNCAHTDDAQCVHRTLNGPLIENQRLAACDVCNP